MKQQIGKTNALYLIWVPSNTGPWENPWPGHGMRERPWKKN